MGRYVKRADSFANRSETWGGGILTVIFGIGAGVDWQRHIRDVALLVAPGPGSSGLVSWRARRLRGEGVMGTALIGEVSNPSRVP